MKIAICSDLHLEFGDIDLTNDEKADILVLSGDIMISQELHDHPEPEVPHSPEILKLLGSRQLTAQRYRGFLNRVSNEFPHVILIAGNHEFYHGKFYAGLEYLKEECSKYSNIYFLEDATKTIDDVTFIGCTLWTDMNKGDPITLHAIRDMMTDFTIIRNDKQGYTKLRPAHTTERHHRSLQFIRVALQNCGDDSKVVIVGHHAPSSKSVAPQYVREVLMNGGYYSDLSDFILDHPQIKLWTHGHTHHEFDYMIGDTRIICNPRGYAGYEARADDFKLKYVEV